MPFHDLNLLYTKDHAQLTHTLAFHKELGYDTVAVAVSVVEKVPSQPPDVPISAIIAPAGLSVLRRLTLTISDVSQNHRLPALQQHYDIVALRPTSEKVLQLACSSLECDLISIDFSRRLPFILKFKTIASALQRGVRFEISYAPGIIGANDAKRNLISGAGQLIRATRGRGIIISSEARSVLGVRAPLDVINLAQVWGLSQERGKEAVCEAPGKSVRLAALKRTSFRGVVNIIDGGSIGQQSRPTEQRDDPGQGKQKESNPAGQKKAGAKGAVKHEHPRAPTGTKRKASASSLIPEGKTSTTVAPNVDEKPLSKREQKRRAKKAKIEARQERQVSKATSDFLSGNANAAGEAGTTVASQFPVAHTELSNSNDSQSRTPARRQLIAAAGANSR